MKNIFVSDDGFVKGTEEEVLKYENNLKLERERKEKLNKEKEIRIEAIKECEEKLTELKKRYFEDYGHLPTSIRLNTNGNIFLEELMRII